jgi:hypothetical protein
VWSEQRTQRGIAGGHAASAAGISSRAAADRIAKHLIEFYDVSANYPALAFDGDEPYVALVDAWNVLRVFHLVDGAWNALPGLPMRDPLLQVDTPAIAIAAQGRVVLAWTEGTGRGYETPRDHPSGRRGARPHPTHRGGRRSSSYPARGGHGAAA